MPPTPPKLPSRVESEAEIVGCVLVKATFLHTVRATGLQAKHFYDPSLAAIYAAMVALDDASRPVDALTIVRQMEADETVEKLRARGGDSFFGDLMGLVTAPENVAYHARQVHATWRMRVAIEECEEIARQGRLQHVDVAEFMEALPARLHALMATTVLKTSARIREVVAEVERDLDERVRAPMDAPRGIATNLRKVDRLLRGRALQMGWLVAIGARAKVGKTSFVMQVAYDAGVAGDPVLIFSLEMTRKELTQREIAGRARLPQSTLDMPHLLQPAESVRLAAALNAVRSANIDIDDSTTAISAIVARARAWRMNHTGRRGLIVVDYLQLVEGPKTKDQNREREVASISRTLKLLAKELNVCILAPVQLNKRVDERGNKRPQLADIRESGAIEQDADAVVFIYRDELYNPDTDDKGVAEIIVAAQRSGETGTARVRFVGEFTRFEDIVERSADDAPHWTENAQTAARKVRRDRHPNAPEED